MTMSGYNDFKNRNHAILLSVRKNAQKAEKSSLASPICNVEQATPSPSVFPVKLHRLLSAAETSGNDDVISWLPDGKSFKVHDRHRFAKELMPAFFGSIKYRSFQRNLNLWNFTVKNVSPHRGVCSHPFFVRDDPLLCEMMKRKPVNKKERGDEDEAEENVQEEDSDVSLHSSSSRQETIVEDIEQHPCFSASSSSSQSPPSRGGDNYNNMITLNHSMLSSNDSPNPTRLTSTTILQNEHNSILRGQERTLPSLSTTNPPSTAALSAIATSDDSNLIFAAAQLLLRDQQQHYQMQEEGTKPDALNIIQQLLLRLIEEKQRREQQEEVLRRILRDMGNLEQLVTATAGAADRSTTVFPQAGSPFPRSNNTNTHNTSQEGSEQDTQHQLLLWLELLSRIQTQKGGSTPGTHPGPRML